MSRVIIGPIKVCAGVLGHDMEKSKLRVWFLMKVWVKLVLVEDHLMQKFVEAPSNDVMRKRKMLFAVVYRLNVVA